MMSNQTPLMPEQQYRRSLAWRAWASKADNGLSLGVRDEGVVMQQMGTHDAAMAERCGLVDLSVLDRCGFRGQHAAAHLQELGLPIPAQPNQAIVSNYGDVTLRLSAREFWVLSAAEDHEQRLRQLALKPLPTNCYSLYCQHSHAWLLLSGHHRAEVMAKLCAVDLRSSAFPVDSIAQTSVARSNAIVAHHRWGRHDAFSLLCDSAYAEYLWEAVLDAMSEFGGGPVGLKDLA